MTSLLLFILSKLTIHQNVEGPSGQWGFLLLTWTSCCFLPSEGRRNPILLTVICRPHPVLGLQTPKSIALRFPRQDGGESCFSGLGNLAGEMKKRPWESDDGRKGGVSLEARTLIYGEKQSVCSAGCVWGYPWQVRPWKEESELMGLAASFEHVLMGGSGAGIRFSFHWGRR